MVQETKQVRVDNWGIYFLQRLQLFFSKTDYCDLTLQFEGNVQLKVHRLVMNACTEYFMFLEQTCPAIEENTIMMPGNLQADVIVPIVNFMYTGMLEFHPSIFHKLYKAAEIMNIAILTKLLEAQMETAMKAGLPKRKLNNRPVKQEMHKREIPAVEPEKPSRYDDPMPSYSQSTPSVGIRTTAASSPKSSPLPSIPHEDVPTPVSLATTNRSRAHWRRRQPSSAVTALPHPASATFPEVKWQPVALKEEKSVVVLHDSTPRPTRFEWPDADLLSSNFMDSSFDENISLTSRPLVTKREEEERAGPSITYNESRSYSRRQNSVSADPDSSYVAEHQKTNFNQEERDEKPSSVAQTGANKRKLDPVVNMVSPKRIKQAEKENEEHTATEHTISIRAPKSSGEVDHTKIVHEILKKYPGLVKKNKNIKLKIMTKPDAEGDMVNHKIRMQISNSPEPPAVENDSPKASTQPLVTNKPEPTDPLAMPVSKKTRTKRSGPDGPWTCLGCDDKPEFVLYYLFRKHLADVHNEVFDHTFCKYCDRRCSSEVTMAYHLHVKHNLKPPAKMNFPKCPKCTFIGITSKKLEDHVEKHSPENVQCPNCKLGFENIQYLKSHRIFANHNNLKGNETRMDCLYCTLKKKMLSPVSLFNHIKESHIREAQRDKIISLHDNMDFEDPEEEIFEGEDPESEESEDVQQQKDKVKIISNVKVAAKPHKEEALEEDQEEETAYENSETTESATIDSQALANVNVPSTISNNLGLVDIVVLDENRQYILQQGSQHHQPDPGTEFILPQDLNNDALLQAASNELNSTDELVMVLTDQDYHHHQDGQSSGQPDNSNIVVLYSHPVEGQGGQFITSQGNIMVNSQTGLLEIRNGAGISTTDGDILVNQQMANDNHAESIELIEKELQQNSFKEKAAVKREKSSQHVKSNQQVCEADSSRNSMTKQNVPSGNDKEENYESSKEEIEESSIANIEKQSDRDLTDSVTHDEPMEVDEDAPEQTIQNVGDEYSQTQDKNTVEPSKDVTEQGVDVPPELNSLEEHSERGKLDASVEENVILNETGNSLGDAEESTEDEKRDQPSIQSNQNQDTHQEVTQCQDEPMEVDGKVKSSALDQIDSASEETEQNDQNEIKSSDITSNTKATPSEIQENACETNEPEIQHQLEGEKEGDSVKSVRLRDEVQRDLNKAILEDWEEDTDSQQSGKHDISAESTDGTDTANVSKLMDDWEDEEDGN